MALSLHSPAKILVVLVLSAALASAAQALPVCVDDRAVDAWPHNGLLSDSLQGKSGKLMARIFNLEHDGAIRILRELFGDSTVDRPGVYTATDSLTGKSFSFISLLPFSAKAKGRVGTYLIGNWPRERRRTEGLPEGFIEVTAENQETLVSENFRLKDFLTHDQQAIWPKYLVLQEALIDKLELIISDLRERGHAVERVAVMSGFRTPQYNSRGVQRGGRAADSRHQYGDAADIFVDNDGNGRMDDLNGDGRVDLKDTRIVLQSVERVERQFPDLVGGAGLYRATKAHGPFVHVDVRGARVRWGLIG